MSCLQKYSPIILKPNWSIIGSAILVFWFWKTQALYGFNPTDDGFVLSQSWRLVHGEIPHVNFTSPRPLGSALIHAPFVLIPYGMLAVSRLFVVFQFFWIARMSVKIGSRSKQLHGTYAEFCLIAIAFLVNLGTWPVMAWHTVDGIFLGITAIAYSQENIKKSCESFANWVVPLLLAGFSPLVKQGFILIPVVIFIQLIAARKIKLILFSGVMAVPTFLYLLLLVIAPGNATSQLHSGSFAELEVPFRMFFDLIHVSYRFLIEFLVVALTVSILASRQLFSKRKGMLFVGFLTFVFIHAVSSKEHLGMGGDWSFYLILSLVIVWSSISTEISEFFVLFSTLALSFAVCLSWGVPNPGLVAGTNLVIALMVVFNFLYKQNKRSPMASTSIKIFLTVLLCLGVVSSTYYRNKNVYAEPEKRFLKSEVNAPQFQFIKMSPQSAAYIESVRVCLDDYPSDHVAILPDGPGLYPLLGIANPFDSDWWLRAERVFDKTDRDLRTIEELNDKGNFLVLRQSYSVFSLRGMKTLDVDIRANGESYFDDPLDSKIFENLNGVEISCSSFTGKYKSNGP